MRARLERDFERFKRELPGDLAGYMRGAYRIDLTARYLGRTLPHPIGKGSGQLSLSLEQLETDRAAGLAFVVLKTVIAEDPEGERSMGAWAIHETRMKVERRRSASDREGWTVTWKGRGWDRSFDEYLALVRAAGDYTRSGEIVAVPSVKYHLPRLGEPFRTDEYRYTTERLAEAWGEDTLPLEKDFSPTLAGDELANEREQILRWLREVPAQVRAAAGSTPVRLALKLMNARFDDAFQLEMLAAAGSADALVVFNRLWDPEQGVAFGGFDLSERNLRVLDAARGAELRTPPLTGTGNVSTGRLIRRLRPARLRERPAAHLLSAPLVGIPRHRRLPSPTRAPRLALRAGRRSHRLHARPGGEGLLDREGGELRFLDLQASITKPKPPRARKIIAECDSCDPPCLLQPKLSNADRTH